MIRNIKNISISLAALATITLMGSCNDYLNSDYLFDERMQLEDVFSNRDYTNEWLAQAYAILGNNYLQDVAGKTYNPFNFDDDLTYNNSGYESWRQGFYDENGYNNNSSNIWSLCYKGIRQAQIFEQNIDNNTLFSESERADMKAQAEFLEGFYYWYLLHIFGPVPLIKEPIDYNLSYDDVAAPRATYDECVDFICEKMLSAAKNLPMKRSYQEIARPTRGAALAYRAKVLTYAASPLMNGKAPESYASQMVDKEGHRLLSDTYDEKKWAKAAAACLDVINLGCYDLYTAGRRVISTSVAYPVTIEPPYDEKFSNNKWPNGWADIDPYESYRSLFNGSVLATDNPEIIFTRGQNTGGDNIRNMVLYMLPVGVGRGYNNYSMTLKQCDAYYMADGTDVPGKDKELGRNADGTERATGYMSDAIRDQYPYCNIGNGVSLQFANREPRFYASVAYNGCTWFLLNYKADNNEVCNQQVFYYRGLSDGYTTSDKWPATGIGVIKYVHPKDIGDGNDYHDQSRRIENTKPDLALRYADILLMYAESLNELTGSYEISSWDGSQTYQISRDIHEMKRGTQPVRIRAGLHDYTDAEYADANTLRAKIKRERQIEFFAEGQRYFDLRRWMDAPVEESTMTYGYNMMGTTTQRDLFYRPVPIQKFPCTFAEKMYFWPICHSELKRNNKLTQNPGWTYPE